MVGWDGEDLPSEEVFRAEIHAAAPRRDPAWVELRLAELKRYLGQPEMTQVLQKPSGGAFLGCEYPILGRSGGGMKRLVVDRLVVELDDAGGPLRASIIDFKTDRVGQEEAAAILAAHGPQLQAYRQAVMARFGLTADLVEAKIVALESGMVVPVPDSMPG